MERITALEAECSTDECKVRALVSSVKRVDEPVKPLDRNFCRRHGIEELTAKRTDFLTLADLGCQAVKCEAKAVLNVHRDEGTFVSRTCRLHALRMLEDANALDKIDALEEAEKADKPKRGKK